MLYDMIWYDMVLISWNETVNLYGFSVSWSPVQLELVLPLLLLFQSKTKVLPLLFAAETLTKLNNDTIDNQDYHESLHQKKKDYHESWWMKGWWLQMMTLLLVSLALLLLVNKDKDKDVVI